MNQKEAAAIIPILQAFVEGKAIQWRSVECETWNTIPPATGLDCRLALLTQGYEWRVKPEPMTIYAALYADGCIAGAHIDETKVKEWFSGNGSFKVRKFIEVIE